MADLLRLSLFFFYGFIFFGQAFASEPSIHGDCRNPLPQIFSRIVNPAEYPAGSSIKVVDHEITPEGVYYIAKDNVNYFWGGPSAFEKRNLLEGLYVFKNFLEKVGITSIKKDGDHFIRYPGDATAINNRAIQLKESGIDVHVRYWDVKNEKDVPVLEFVEHYIRGEHPEIPYTIKGTFHFHDFFTHWAFLLIGKKTFDAQVGVMDFWHKIIKDPVLSQNKRLSDLASKALTNYVNNMDSITASLPRLLISLSVRAERLSETRPMTKQSFLKTPTLKKEFENIKIELLKLAQSKVNKTGIKIQGQSGYEIGTALKEAILKNNRKILPKIVLSEKELKQLDELIASASHTSVSESEASEMTEEILRTLDVFQ